MAERRKILIPTGAEEGGSLETPHFDTEAAKAARPVVPLSPDAVSDLGPLPQGVHYTQSEPVRRSRVSPWLLSLIILAAMSAGAAGALALDYYRNHKHQEAQETPAQTSAVAADTRPSSADGSALEEGRKIEPTATPMPVQPKAEPSPTPAASVPVTEKSPEPAAATTARPKPDAPERAASRKGEDGEQPAPAREARRERRESADATRIEDTDLPRARRQRQPRDIEVRPDQLPPQIRRAGQELHRIREIFEGSRP